MDGLAVELVYRDGALEAASTRGDGETGEEVTANVRTIQAVPLTLLGDAPPPLLEARAEVYCELAAFSEFNRRALEKEEKFQRQQPGEEGGKGKRRYNSMASTTVTEEEMEAYRMKKSRSSHDPMAKLIDSDDVLPLE